MLSRRSITYIEKSLPFSNLFNFPQKTNTAADFLGSLSLTECITLANRRVMQNELEKDKTFFNMANVVHVMPYDDGHTDMAEMPKYTNAWEEKKKGLKECLKPLLWCLKLSGLLHSVDIGVPCQKNEVTNMISRKYCSPFIFYNVLVLGLLWTNVAFSMLPFRDATGFDGYVCNQIITATWFVQVACIAVNNALSCKHWSSVFKAWDRCAKNVDLDTKRLIHKSVLIGTVLYCVWMVVELCFTGLGSYLLTGNLAGSGMFKGSDSLNAFILVLFWIIFFYFSSTWYLLTAAFCIMATGIYKAFKTFYKRFSQAFVEGKFKGDVERYRLYHDGLVRLLAAVDNMFSMYILLAIGTIIPLIILTLYFVLFESIDTFSYVATWWSVSLSFVQMMVIFIGGGLVNHMAHYPIDVLYSIDLAALTAKECHQVSVFLSQLSSHPIGFTAFGLFTIDKPTIITFAGSIVTYAVVVIQFKPTDSTSDTPNLFCNCSCA